MSKKTKIIISVAIVVLAFISWYFYSLITNIFCCGQPPILENIDNQTDDINEVEENFGNQLEKLDLIVLESPQPNESVKSPLQITGRARGPWFFEASFPIYVTDWDGLIIGQGIAQAEGEWMTTEFVPFTATINFDVTQISGQYSKNGTLILQKDNPSGEPQFDDALEIPIKFQ